MDNKNYTQEELKEYKYGYCYPMAMSLSEQYQLPIKILAVDLENESGNTVHIVHAFIKGENEDFDILGSTDEEKLTEEFLQNSTRRFCNPRFLEIENTENFIDFIKEIHTGHLAKFLKADLRWLLEKKQETDVVANWFYNNHQEYSSRTGMKM